MERRAPRQGRAVPAPRRGALALTGAAVALSAALALVTASRLPAAWASGNALNHVSGAWMALADDLAHGTLYRPLHHPALGYGGTRFFPLTFALQAALVRAGLPVVGAAELLSLAAALAAAAGASLFLRRAGHGPWAARALAVLPLAGAAGQLSVADGRGDLPASALAIWGLAILLPSLPAAGSPAAQPAWNGRGPLAGPATLLVLAFLAKPTALAAAAAAVAFLLLRGDRRAALRLALAVCAGAAAGATAVDLASGGRFLSLLASLGSGGMRPADLAHAPARLAGLLLHEDAAGAALAAAGAAAGAWIVRPGGRARASPAALLAILWLAAAGAAALATLATPGTGLNHLLEPEAASALLAGAALAARPPWLVRATVALAAAAGLATAATTWHRDLDGGGRLAALRAALGAAQPGAPSPLLSEDPLLPLCAGERPFLLDPWMFRLAAAQDPALARPLLAALRDGAFRAVVLLDAADAPDADEWFASELGPAALAEIRARWVQTFSAGPYHVYRFRPEPRPGLPR